MKLISRSRKKKLDRCSYKKDRLGSKARLEHKRLLRDYKKTQKILMEYNFSDASKGRKQGGVA